MHILVAPNAFKHSLSAAEAAAAIGRGLRASTFTGGWTLRPVADGGDGTAQLLTAHLGGRTMMATVHDPLGRQIESHFALVDGGRTAVIELAAASGLRLLRDDELNPLRAGSAGTGELMSRALDCGVGGIVLCVGGSATVDGGAGLLRALGVAFRGATDEVLTLLPESLVELSRIDLTGLDQRLAGCSLTVLCDVDNPLLGEQGAARIFGPQKGATPAAVQALEAALARFSHVVQRQTGNDIAMTARGGAAGGVAAGLYGIAHAALVSGTDYFLDRIDFDRELTAADLVITGEGSLDEQTVNGKAPWGVAVRAKAKGAFVVGMAGQVPLRPSPALRSCFDALLPIGHRAMPLAEALECTAENLERTAFDLGNILHFGGDVRPSG
jgi:glycerate kinase